MQKNVIITKREKTKAEMFLAQLNDPLIFILLGALVICALMQEWADTIIIAAVILTNAIIGVVQEGKAQAALAALQKMTAPMCLVKLPDGTIKEIPAEDLTVGDIVVLEAGRQVPADLRLIEAVSLKVDESALTGESVPVEKDINAKYPEDAALSDKLDHAYMSTNITYGRGLGEVIAIGMDTEIGKIARMLAEQEDELTPLQKRLADLGKVLGISTIIICALLLLISLLRGNDLVEMAITAISLAVAAVPEGLPAVVTIVLALGVQRLVAVNTIVKRLPAVETLGAVNIVCSDKTGTLTQNKMTVVEHFGDDELIRGFCLCNDAIVEADGTEIGDPTETALVIFASKHNLKKADLERDFPRVDEKAFDSERKMMTTVHTINGEKVAYTKGAADEILKRCVGLKNEAEIRSKMSEMADSALRVLAIAKGNDTSEENLTFIGLVGMVDPPRPEAKAAVEIFKKAGVKTIMITGDHKQTAFAIAKELGIATSIDQCLEGAEITDELLAEKIDNLRVFARVSPENKVQIVKALKAKGNIVSMTGDGVNDAPSLKAADIGVAMGITGTDVAKGAADMVLTDDNFATIEKAIEEGRGIYENIKKTVLFLLSSNFGEITTMLVAIAAGFLAPLRATMVLWINLITDSLPALALGVDKNHAKHLMNRPPRNPKESLFANGGMLLTIGYGILIGGLSLLGYYMGSKISHEAGQTYAFCILGLSQLFHAIGMRNIRQSIFTMNHGENRMMILAFALGFMLQIAVTEIPFLTNAFHTTQLSPSEWGILTGLAAVPLAVHELAVLVQLLKKKKSTIAG